MIPLRILWTLRRWWPNELGRKLDADGQARRRREPSVVIGFDGSRSDAMVFARRRKAGKSPAPPTLKMPAMVLDLLEQLGEVSERSAIAGTEASGVMHAKLLDDTRCCPVAEAGGFSTVFWSIVNCQACLQRLAEIAAARK